MNGFSDKSKNRKSRGQVSVIEICQYSDLSDESVLLLLQSSNPQERTIGAAIIGDKKLVNMTSLLCAALRVETCLYPRIAISESLGKMGIHAVIPLINLLGKIGNNQETCLPIKYFNKKSYPLPRDIAARTLTKIGIEAIPGLTNRIVSSDGFETQQAIDALGSIVSKLNDRSPLESILLALDRYSANEMTTWKIVRALSGFKFAEAVNPLLLIAETHPEAAVRWEAIRSIGQIGIRTPDIMNILMEYSNDDNIEIRKASMTAIEQLTKVHNI